MYEKYRALAQRLMKSQPLGTVTRDSGAWIDENRKFLGKLDGDQSFTCPMLKTNVKVNERGLFDNLLVNKLLIESEGCIILAPNDAILSVDNITKFKIDDRIVFGENEFLIRSKKEINPDNGPIPILSYLLCEVV